MSKGVLFIVSAASGTGKDTIVSEVIRNNKDTYVLSVSMTTRSPRGDEKEGIDYYYVSEDAFERNIESGLMLEYAKYGRYYYGTPLKPVRRWLDEGKTVFLIIEVQGAAIVRNKLPEAKSVFIIPPSMEVLEKRMRDRKTDDEESIKRRLIIAKDEIARAGEFDYILLNDDLDTAVSEFESLCKYEISSLNGLSPSDDDLTVSNKLKADKMLNIVSEVLKNE